MTGKIVATGIWLAVLAYSLAGIVKRARRQGRPGDCGCKRRASLSQRRDY